LWFAVTWIPGLAPKRLDECGQGGRLVPQVRVVEIEARSLKGERYSETAQKMIDR
jgi:hypothetical protein